MRHGSPSRRASPTSRDLCVVGCTADRSGDHGLGAESGGWPSQITHAAVLRHPWSPLPGYGNRVGIPAPLLARADKHDRDGARKDPEIESEGPPIDVGEVALDPAVKLGFLARLDLP